MAVRPHDGSEGVRDNSSAREWPNGWSEIPLLVILAKAGIACMWWFGAKSFVRLRRSSHFSLDDFSWEK